jgi:C1A family cysteine protease/predicted secreted protein
MQIEKPRTTARRASLLVGAVFLLGSLLPLTPAVAVPAFEGAGSGAFTVSEQDDGRRIELVGNQVLELDLEGNLTTGYSWEVAETDERVLREVGAIEFEPHSALLGAPGRMTRRFEAVGPGETDLVLVYRRPWEKGTPDRTFSVYVQAAGPFARPDTPDAHPGPAVPKAVSKSPPTLAERVTEALPSFFNWCDQGGCTLVKDQGGCGSCWAFATVGPLESLIRLNDGVERDLAEQYLVSCNTDDWGCDGGWWAHDYHHWKVPPREPDAGAVYEADFPYVASDVSCNPPHAHHEKIESWAQLGAASGVPPVADIKQAIYDHGPVAVAICVGSAFQAYGGGVFQADESYVCGSGVNHGVVLVGWDDSQEGGIWYLRNSWGPGWGEGGYMRIRYGTSRVGYGASYVVYAGNTTPNAPAALQAMPASQTQINLSWTDDSPNEDGFTIERSPNGSGAWTQIASVAANVTTYANTGLALRKTYYFRVRAFNAIGNSSYSNVAQATTFGEFVSKVCLPVVLRGAGPVKAVGSERGPSP